MAKQKALPVGLDAPRYRPDDPATSRAAAWKLNEKLSERQQTALDMVRRNPGLTGELLDQKYAQKIYRATGRRVPQRTIARRLRELERGGLITKDGTMRSTFTGRECARWYPLG